MNTNKIRKKALQIGLLLLFLAGINGNIQAQDYLITFAVIGGNETPDNVLVKNQNQLTSLTLNGNDVLHLVDEITGISSDVSFNQPLKVSPNPIAKSGTLTFYNPKKENVHIAIYNSAGLLMAQKLEILPQGEHSYIIEGLGVGTHIVSVSTNRNNRSVVLISNAAAQSKPSIVHVNSDYTVINKQEKSASDKTINPIVMQYNDGENLEFTAFLNNFTSIVELVPASSQTVSFNFSAPTAAFLADLTNIVEGEAVTFTDQSLNSPDSWSWSFGDGSTSNQANPSYTYNNAGAYTVELTVSNNYGSDTETKTAYITVESGGVVGTVTDIDGNVYATIQIAEQRWMAENLKTTKYNNGTSVELITDNTAWENNTSGAYCWFDNDEAQYAETNGALYNFYAANTNNLCPEGWHVPTYDDWTVLENYIAADGHAGNEGKAIKATYGWPSGGNGTDNYGYTALPGDMRFSYGDFSYFDFGYWWSATEHNTTDAKFCGLYATVNYIYRSNYNKKSGFSVRCLKD